jgi:POT family proton-dependent oligopeptide transporter
MGMAGFGLAGIAMRSYSICLGTKFLGHVGSLDVQEANTVDESSYGLLFKNLLKSQMQLSLTIILSVYPLLDGIV